MSLLPIGAGRGVWESNNRMFFDLTLVAGVDKLEENGPLMILRIR